MIEAEYYKLTKPERDAWVAEKLLGYIVHGGAISYNPKTGGGRKTPDSDDYNVVHEVIEKLKEAGYNIVIRTSLCDEWIVDIGDGPYGVSEQLRDAVYLAAGRAKGVIE